MKQAWKHAFRRTFTILSLATAASAAAQTHSPGPASSPAWPQRQKPSPFLTKSAAPPRGRQPMPAKVGM